MLGLALRYLLGSKPAPLRRGRPRRVGPAPWEILGYSKRTYYRRKKLGLLPKGKK